MNEIYILCYILNHYFFRLNCLDFQLFIIQNISIPYFKVFHNNIIQRIIFHTCIFYEIISIQISVPLFCLPKNNLPFNYFQTY